MSTNLRKNLLKGIASTAIVTAMIAGNAFSIVPNENTDSDAIVDDEGGVNGVGQLVVSNGGGSVGLCTGTLINPRTVIFAAHCVNSRPEDAYGWNTGGVAASFGFSVDNLPAVQNWFRSGFQTSAADFLYNINHINWHPDSLNDAFGAGFLEADVAMATLDTPTRDIPTWAMLFSALPDPGTIDGVTGTGYHVNLTGYGATGNAIQGPVEGIDFRRRLVENFIGALASLDEVDAPVFGPGPSFLPQSLYFTDFDSQEDENGLRIGGGGFPDFNLFRDDALPNEGTTAGGDSGGPLILDAANNTLSTDDLVLGVLSGGSRSFGGAQPFSSLGTSSFYQPLYLFYDYIAANNAYKYVGAAEGDGNWEDATHWTSLIDPNYRIIDANGDVVVGIPDVQADGVLGTDPDFGAVCTQNIFGANGANVCTDLATGAITPTTPAGDDIPATEGANGIQSGIGIANISDIWSGVGESNISDILGGDVNFSAEYQAQGGDENVATVPENQSQAPGDPNPAPTIDNGLPGATNFTPDNVDPTVNGDSSINAARYYDVTLSNSGTTTLSSTVEIDRLTVTNMAGLDISAAGSLNSLIDITQSGGSVNVDGALSTPGDYFMMSGLLTGTGTITTPFFTNVMGAIAPGSLEDIGTLTIDGNAILSSASGLMINLSSNGVSDVLTLTGDSSLDGTVMFSADENVLFGNEYTFLTTGGTQTGELTSMAISTILFADLVHEANSVKAVINAKSFDEAIDTNNAVQSSYAKMLDGNRGSGNLSAIFASLDLATPAAIQAAFNAWAPITETTVQSVGKSMMNTQSQFYRNRMSSFNKGEIGGTLTTAGRPVQLAALGSAGMESVLYADASGDAMSTRAMPGLKSDYALYLMGGITDGSGKAMPGTGFADDEFDGWNIYAGIEKLVSEHLIVGAGVSYADMDATSSLGQTATGTHFSGTVYGQIRSETNMVAEGQISLGRFNNKTSRVVGGSTLETDADNTTLSAEIGLAKEFTTGGLMISPGARVRHNLINLDSTPETGGGPALAIQRGSLDSTHGLFGFEIKTINSKQLELRMNADYVQNFSDTSNGGETFLASFANGNASAASFAAFGEDTSWGEVGAGVNYNASDMVDIVLSVNTTVGRSDIDLQSYQGGIRIKF